MGGGVGIMLPNIVLKGMGSQINSWLLPSLVTLLKPPVPQFLFVVCMVCLLTKSGQEIRIKYKIKFKIHPIKWIHSCNKLSTFESYGCKSQLTQAELIKQLPAKGQSLLNNYILIHVLFLLLELLCLKVSRWLVTMKHFNKLYEWRHVIGVKGSFDAWWVSTGIASWHLSPKPSYKLQRVRARTEVANWNASFLTKAWQKSS